MNAQPLSIRTELETPMSVDRRFETVEEVLTFCQTNSVHPVEMFRYLEAEEGGEYAPVPLRQPDAPVLTLSDVREEMKRQVAFVGHRYISHAARRCPAVHAFLYNKAGLQSFWDAADFVGMYGSDIINEATR